MPSFGVDIGLMKHGTSLSILIPVHDDIGEALELFERAKAQLVSFVKTEGILITLDPVSTGDTNPLLFFYGGALCACRPPGR